jgi:hypothetical protein
MGKFLTIWTQSPTAPWPTDPAEALKLNEMLWATVDGLLKKGEITDFGWFMDGRSGYAIGEGSSVTVFKNVNMFSTYFDMTVEEIIPYETGKEVNRARLNAIIAMTNQ